MISDFNETDPQTDLRADLCIVGAGAAGITIAREFAGSGLKVIVLESGGIEYEQETQDLYAGENVGQFYSLTENRLRYLGGTTNHWSGTCGPLDEIDFKARPWVPNSGWPFTRADLLPYYKKAQKVLRLGPFFYGSDVWDHVGAKPLALDLEKLDYGFKQFREFPVRFGTEFFDDLQNAKNVQVFLHANVVNIHQNSDGRSVTHLDVQTLQGKRGRVSARYFVLACGALENARLLLVSTSQEPAGVGNRHDVVGRYFIEHPQFWVGLVFPKNVTDLRDRFAQHFAGDVRYIKHLKASAALQKREKILNSLIFPDEILKAKSGVAALREIMAALRSKRKKLENLDEKVWQILADLDDVAVNTWRRFVSHMSTIPPVDHIDLEVESEQVPNPESRVTLLAAKDALGLNRLRLNWKIGDLEKRTARILGQLVAGELGRLGMGRVKLDEQIVYESRDARPHCICHQMGTTRMSVDPSKGVVDGNCLIHGLSNFFVAGSSVFPTGGAKNPTLTIVAMSLRLAEHLKAQLT